MHVVLINFSSVLRKNSFSQTSINEWNKSDNNVFECTAVLNFKFKIDKYLKSQGFI